MKKIVSIQADIKLSEVQTNQNNILKLLELAKKKHDPDIIILPETWNVGFFPENVSDLADEANQSKCIQIITDWARENQVNVVAGSIALKENNDVRNRAFVINRNGEIVTFYDKIHLFSPGDEDNFFESGSKYTTFELDGITCGIIICYDLRFPELSRKLAIEGAQILFVPAEWPYPRLEHWKTLSQARAIENQMFVITCNGVGTAGDLKFCGHSSIIDPFGVVLSQGKDDEQLIFGEIDINKVSEAREKIPVFRDRKEKSLYE